jgi:hypothetical protein
MRWTRWLVVAGVALALGARSAGADGAPPGAPRGDWLAEALALLRVRMEAKLGEAQLLERAGRHDEALAAYRSAGGLFDSGLAEIRALRRPAPDSAGPSEPTPPESIARPPRTATQAIDDALRWLAAHQAPDGSWSAAGFQQWCDGKPNPASSRPDGVGKPMYDPGVTGLALLAFLGAGHEPRSDSRHRDAVGRGLEYLKAVQDPEGCIGPRTTQHYAYNHAIGSLAMVEAYAVTESAILEESAQKALDFIALARNPYLAWRYGVRPGDNDTSVTGWMTLSLLAAKRVNEAALRAGRPAPFQIDETAFDGARTWIDKMTDPDTGRVGYIQQGGGPARSQELVDRFPPEKSEAMTAVGVFLRLLLGESASTSPLVRSGAELIQRLPPRWDPSSGAIDMYYWYYGTLATFQVGGEAWAKWNAALLDQVLPAQRLDGDPCGFRGSFDPIDPWGPDGGRVYSTAILTLALEVSARGARASGSR